MGKEKAAVKDPTIKRFTGIVLVGIVGILVNIALGVIKIIVGNAADSVAVRSDAVNNFADSISSLVTIITMAIVAKGATRKHPFGFGRVEYFSSLIISVLVLVTGGEFLINSIKKIVHPAHTDYSVVALVMLGVAIAAKILLGLYTRNAGKKYDSPNLKASGQDALSDAIITGVTLLGALLSRYAGLWKLDGWIGAVVSIFVLKGGLEILIDVLNKLMGERPSVELAEKIRSEIDAVPEILGSYDLILHNYGPNIYIGDVNVELPENMSIRDAYEITKPLNIRIQQKYGVFVYFGFYAVNTTEQDVMDMNNKVKEILMKDPSVLQVHAFYVDKDQKFMSFDTVLDFSVKEPIRKEEELRNKLQPLFPDYEIRMTADRDFTLNRPEVKGEVKKEAMHK